MQKIHKINFMMAGVFTIFLLGVKFYHSGFEQTTLDLAVAMISACVVIGIMVCLKRLNDVVRGTVITLAIAFSALAVSVVEGGNNKAFLITFVVLGFGLLYFNRKILAFYMAVYLPATLAAAILNPLYIVGQEGNPKDAITFIILYALLGVMIIVACGRGEKVLKDMQKNATQLAREAELSAELSEELHQSILSGQAEAGITKQSAHSIGDAAAKLTQATDELARAAAAASQGTVSLSDRISGSSTSFRSMSEQFTQVVALVDDGSTRGTQVKQLMSRANSAMLAANEEVQRLQGELGKMASIVSDVNSVARQTKLLSLNASVEAARAGAAGKGFAVVAAEIRKLAEESSDAFKNISNLIQSFENTMHTVASSVDEGSASIAKGDAQLETLAGLLTNIAENAHEANSLLQQQDAVLAEMTENSAIVSSQIQDMDTLTQHNASMLASVNEALRQQNTAVLSTFEEFETLKQLSGRLVQEI